MSNAIEIKHLCKKYKEFSLEDVNIVLPTGSIMGFIGENGAGKSTTIKLIMDIIKKDSGEIRVFDGKLLSENIEIKENIGVVMDEMCFPETLNISNINCFMNKIYKTWDKNKFLDFCKSFDLPLKKGIKDLSRGMKMKLSIAVALSHDTKLLILDEATSGLDPIVRDEILDIFMEFIQDENKSIFISSHIISDLEKICDYITFIHKGKIIFSQSKDEIIEKYGIIRCSNDDFESMNKEDIIGFRKNNFGVEALVERKRVSESCIVDRATIEDVMLYYVKESKQ